MYQTFFLGLISRWTPSHTLEIYAVALRMSGVHWYAFHGFCAALIRSVIMELQWVDEHMEIYKPKIKRY